MTGVFTGIVEGIGRIVTTEPFVAGRRLGVELPPGFDAAPGDSVAVDGVCLTADEVIPGHARFTLSPETLRRTTLGAYRPGHPVNLERALTPAGRLGGHLVLGHVDATAEVRRLSPPGSGEVELAVALPGELSAYVALKGSVAVNGVSLTVAKLERDEFAVALIPYTIERTTLGRLRPGEPVNVEVDVLARYVVRLVSVLNGGRRDAGAVEAAQGVSPVSWELLAQHGFLARSGQGGR